MSGTAMSRSFLYPSFLGRTTTVVRHRRHVLDHRHFNAALGQGAHSAFPTGTGTFYKYIHTLHTGVYCHFGGIGRSHLGRIGSILLRTPETHLAGAGPGDHLSL